MCICLFWRYSEISKRKLSVFLMDQNRLGGVINQLNQAGIGEHIYCVLCKRMTPAQKQIVRKEVQSLHTVVH
jgi:siroheme synthase